jgi:hypothetical protein
VAAFAGSAIKAAEALNKPTANKLDFDVKNLVLFIVLNLCGLVGCNFKN